MTRSRPCGSAQGRKGHSVGSSNDGPGNPYGILGIVAVGCPNCGAPVRAIHRTLAKGNPGRFVYHETCNRCGTTVTIQRTASTEMMGGEFPLSWVSKDGRWGIIGYEPLTVRWDGHVIGCLALFCADDDSRFSVYLRDDGTLIYGVNDDERDVYPSDVLTQIDREMRKIGGWPQTRHGFGSPNKGGVPSRSARPSIDIEVLATDLAVWMEDFDPYEFRDAYDSIADAIEDNVVSLGTRAGLGWAIDWLDLEVGPIDYDDDLERRRKDLILRLNRLRDELFMPGKLISRQSKGLPSSGRKAILGGRIRRR